MVSTSSSAGSSAQTASGFSMRDLIDRVLVEDIVLVRLNKAAYLELGLAFAENSDAAAFRDHIQPISTENKKRKHIEVSKIKIMK